MAIYFLQPCRKSPTDFHLHNESEHFLVSIHVFLVVFSLCVNRFANFVVNVYKKWTAEVVVAVALFQGDSYKFDMSGKIFN